MREPVTIKSVNSDYSLTFSLVENDYFTVDVQGADRSAQTRVWGYTDCQFLVGLFESIAKDWRGWDGVRDWSSIEGEFQLFASSDRLGHVTLRTVLTNTNCGPSEPWTLEASLVMEAGQLEAVSRDIADFFGESGV
jgi:hypothetical protein